jgi:hypothetical protein
VLACGIEDVVEEPSERLETARLVVPEVVELDVEEEGVAREISEQEGGDRKGIRLWIVSVVPNVLCPAQTCWISARCASLLSMPSMSSIRTREVLPQAVVYLQKPAFAPAYDWSLVSGWRATRECMCRAEHRHSQIVGLTLRGPIVAFGEIGAKRLIDEESCVWGESSVTATAYRRGNERPLDETHSCPSCQYRRSPGSRAPPFHRNREFGSGNRALSHCAREWVVTRWWRDSLAE